MRDENYRPRGFLIASKVEMMRRLNRPDTFIVNVSAESAQQATRLREGWGLVVQDGDFKVSGVITQFFRTAKDNNLEVEVTCTSELAFLGDRLTYPDPAHEETQQQAARWQERGACETVIKNLVAKNLGVEALEARRVPGFAVAPSQGRGGDASVDTRLKNLLDVVEPMATAGGLRMNVQFSPGALTFDTIPTRNLSRRVRLSWVSGEVIGWEMTDRAPSVTAVIVGGQGEGVDRRLDARQRLDSWRRRIEIFKDRRDTDDAGALEKTANEELDKGISERIMKVTVQESDTRKFGVAFDVGDTITLDVAPNVTPYDSRIVEAKIMWSDNMRTVELTAGALDLTLSQERIERLRREIAQLATV